MNHQVIEHKNQKYIEVTSSSPLLGSEQDALDLVALGMEQQTGLLLLHAEALSEDFFQLKTGVAGAMLQKFINYHMKTAVVLADQEGQHLRFREMVSEANKGQAFRVFETREAAENWLLG
ncbi:DUF4180 domain-containing protein [Deinococcus cellulosilyticus]|uniref:DUF4180 domain-containing protein n=1 Tax=Deinococcus cellulosilyticus (strain DSM 18568 / NBRC 106333 / KACC 11606 / 5516J-15) TaxID=1223518 RepID=A0A511MW82_DEIC1|nr:DUF4180 domain-containing protein [Deinococcus cellulosilyticus]GEM44518.1 hypothetical protein DC3_01530 [Deinococcus cellulosilyticus NBRC 106333 = KACC 11606]